MASKIKIDLTPPEVDLKIYSGDGYTFRLVVTHKNDEDVTVPTNLTGTMEAQIRLVRGTDGTPEAEFSVDMTDAADGIVGLNLSGEDCQNLAKSAKFNGFWDIQWTPDGADPRTFCQGKVEVDLDVSR